jgi:3-oxoacyl-[acyl-carrier-protein] synthase-3
MLDAAVGRSPAAPSERRHTTVAAVHSPACALPANVVGNAGIAATLGVDEHWIVKRTGVTERRHARPEERLSDLATEAGRGALERAGLAPEEIDLVLVATSTPDELMPNAAPLVAHALGARRAGAFDVGAACSGFLGALLLAAGQVESGRARNVLVIGADVMARYLDPHDARSAALVGDGAGALIVAADEHGYGVGSGLMRTDAYGADLVHIQRDTQTFVMHGQDTFRFAVDALSTVTREVLDEAGRELADVDLFVYHQANARILRAVGARLDLPEERVVSTVEWTGNTIAASIPIALAAADAAGRLAPGSLVLLAAIGAGFVWGATLVGWGLGSAEPDAT